MQRRRFRPRSPRRQRGITFIEILMAALILAVCLMTLMNVWLYSFATTRSTDEIGFAYNLARRAIERLRAQGYYYADPTTIPQYYSIQGTALQEHQDSPGFAPSGAPGSVATAPSAAHYRMVTTIANGSDAVAPYNLRQISIVVTRLSDGTELFRTQTYLTQGGN